MATKRPGGLGRGLNALFEDSSLTAEVTAEAEATPVRADKGMAEGITYIDINEIKPNSSQPRRTFDESSINELADSIRSHGLIQPIIVRPSGSGFEIVAGERRWRAARKAELKTVACIVRELTDRENMLLAIIENTQREDLNPIEEALAFEAMIDQYDLTQAEVSKSVGKSRPYITNALRLLKLPDEVKGLLSDNRISGGHARAIAGVEDELLQVKYARMAAEKGLSVRSIERIIAESDEKQRKKKANSSKRSKSPEVISVENELRDILGTKVSLPASTSKGKIEISFYSSEELERLIDMLKMLKNL